MSLATPPEKVEKLQKSLQAKAKAEPGYRFYSLWDKVRRLDVLQEAWRRCRRKGGAAGVDGITFEDIESQDVNEWLGNLQEELRGGRYEPQPLLRVWIPKSNGGQRPLGIATTRERVAQMAVLLVLQPIFEADLQPEQYGFRPGVDAKMAVRRVYWHITQYARREVVDADLSDYFNTIPHGPLMKCVARRIVDGTLLQMLKKWLNAPVEERVGGRLQRTTEARDNGRGVPQGGVSSPMLSNLYFRRFILAWHKFGYTSTLEAHVVNYADDMVICCRPGNGARVMERMRSLIVRLGLSVNEKKTSLVTLPDGKFTFLGYTFGRLYGKAGRPYIGTKPSQKAVTKLLEKIHDTTSRRWLTKSVESRVKELNWQIRGWSGYFNQGPVRKAYALIERYTKQRLRRWLAKKHKQRGVGYGQYPDESLYKELGLINLLALPADLPKAKA